MHADFRVLVLGRSSGIFEEEIAANTFSSFLRAKGVLATSDGCSPNHAVVVDYTSSAMGLIRKAGLSFNTSHLLQQEPLQVLPANYASRRKRQFRTIIRVGGNPASENSVLCPQLWPSDLRYLEFSDTVRADKVILVNGNKLSLIKGELYSLRRNAATTISELELYGTGWNSSLVERMLSLAKALVDAVLNGQLPRVASLNGWFGSYPNWRGLIGSGYDSVGRDKKLEVMAKHKYALVVENSQEYLSEKLFDAFFAGCVPIYVGPSLGSYDIPKGLVIQSEPTIPSLLAAIDKARKLDMRVFRESLISFLSDDRTRQRWSHETVYQAVLDKILKTQAATNAKDPLNP